MARVGAVILAAGKGTRMHSRTKKQFLMWKNKPLFIYSVEKFARFSDITVVVTGQEDLEVCRQYLARYGLDQVILTAGGKKRYDSSERGLLKIEETGGCDIVLIHDAARPFVSEETIAGVIRDAGEFGTGIAAVLSKDTVKIADEKGFVRETPDRDHVYNIQTPQGFRMDLIMDAYAKMRAEKTPGLNITDDAMVMETFGKCPVKLTAGSYDNIKITTPDDLSALKGIES